MPNSKPASKRFRPALAAVILLTAGNIGLAQPVQIGRLDFLKAKDPSIALFAKTSAGARQGKQQPDILVLITGLPSNPTNSRGSTCSAPTSQGVDAKFSHGRNQFISAAGTSWAAMALVLTANPLIEDL